MGSASRRAKRRRELGLQGFAESAGFAESDFEESLVVLAVFNDKN